jgi:hypothetical protein
VRRTAIYATFAVAAITTGTRAEDPPPPAKPESRWLVGDLHVHVSPPDADGHSALTVASAVAAAHKAGLDFIVVTPHDADRTFPVPGDPAAPQISGQELVLRLASDAAKDANERPVLVVSGWEFTRASPGHLGFAFFRMADVAGLADAEKAEAALATGALVTVNHPFFRPVKSDVPLMKLVEGDRRWLPFFGEAKDDRKWNAIEVWHERSVYVEKLHAKLAAKFPETQMVTDAMRAWDAATKDDRRRIAAVGGSDCHGKLPYAISPMPLVSVRVDAGGAEGLRRGLRAAHVTFGKDGGAAARDFAATSDVLGETAAIGDSLRAKTEVRLTWQGKAVLFEDGERLGEFDGGAVRKLAVPGTFHAWRIAKDGDAYSNCIYANLP